MQQITQNVFFESAFRGCNTGLIVTSEGLVVIDTPMAPSEAKKWRQDISHLGEIRYVINNEPHPDHIAGNCWMGGTLVSHDGSYHEILSTSLETIRQMLKAMAPDNLPLDPDFSLRPPDPPSGQTHISANAFSRTSPFPDCHLCSGGTCRFYI